MKHDKDTTDEMQRQLRRQEYFAELYMGSIVQSAEIAVSQTSAPDIIQEYERISISETIESILKLGANRATGPDGVHARLLHPSVKNARTSYHLP